MAKDFHHPKVVAGYDEHIRKLIPGYELMHAQVRATFQVHLAADAHVLIIGCGTGYEIQYLLQHFPKLHITAVDPSLTMLAQAKHNIQHLAQAEQVTLLHGTAADLADHLLFDAALSLLVAHFIDNTHKAQFFAEIYQHLKPNAMLMTYDLLLHAEEYELNILQCICQQQGLTLGQSEQMLARLADDFALISPQGYRDALAQAGFTHIKTYMQIINYFGFFAQKQARTRSAHVELLPIQTT